MRHERSIDLVGGVTNPKDVSDAGSWRGDRVKPGGPVTVTRAIHLSALNDFDEWRAAARALLLDAVPPDQVVWHGPNDGADLFAEPAPPPPQVTDRAVGRVPRPFVELAEAAICHADPARFALLYRVLWRVMKDPELIAVRSDPDIDKLHGRASAVRRDAHKMTAFVRFRQVMDAEGTERFAAWFEPDHYIVERTAPFFVRRFAGMNWAIVTPYRSAFWDGEALRFGPGGRKADVPSGDALEGVWTTYFASIFNPARLKVAMMKSEMPVKYWRNLPEAAAIPALIRTAQEREGEMVARMASQPPARHVRAEARRPAPGEAEAITTIAGARAVAADCTRCPLHQYATQTVFGQGPEHARIMVVGEQPGDQEDLAGTPFVGPAGKVFDEAAREAGMVREQVYVTNAVKHFKFEPRGKRRIHKKPNAGEISACRFWLGLERELVKPKVIVAMGATAAQGVLGRADTVSKLRGDAIKLEDGGVLFVTVHPSYLLRLPDREQASIERQRFVDDLRRAWVFASGD